MLNNVKSPIRGNIKKFLIGATAGVVLLGGIVATVFASGAPSAFFNGFETDTSGWFAPSGFGSITRQPSGYTNGGGYADTVASATGSYHARLTGSCSNVHGAGTDCFGPYTDWGTGFDSDVFPAGGYTTEVSIYLDTAWAATHPDKRFDWDTAIQDTSLGFLSDYVFNAGTIPTGFVIGASPNAGRSSTFPSNPCPNPGPTTPPNVCRTPAIITTSGWYTFRHSFHDDGSGKLAVDMTILDSSSNTVASWTIYQGFNVSNVGGPAYGWFPNEEISDLAIDNSRLSVASTNNLNALSPADMWIGLKNSDDVGTKFDLLAQVYKNGTELVGQGELDNVPGGSSGFNNAVKRSITLAVQGSPTVSPADKLSIKLSARIASTSGHSSGTARLWYNDQQAKSMFDATIDTNHSDYFLLDGFLLGSNAGIGPKKTADVLVSRSGGNPWKLFGTWTQP